MIKTDIESQGKRLSFRDPESLRDYMMLHAVVTCFVWGDGLQKTFVSMDDVEAWAETGNLTGGISGDLLKMV